jgi:hypothetical protein
MGAKTQTTAELVEQHQEELNKLYEEQKLITDTIKTRIEKLKELRIKNERETRPIQVTDHAVIRYLERVEGVDIEEIKKRIVPPRTENCIRTLGSFDEDKKEEYNLGGFNIVVKNFKVITTFIEGGGE